MRPVAMPMPVTVMMRTSLRPALSARWPKMMPPMGRAMKPTAIVPKEASRAVTLSSEAKKWMLKTMAAAVENRKKSYHSMAVPTRAAVAALRAVLSCCSGVIEEIAAVRILPPDG